MLTYNTFTTALANFLVIPVTDANFVSAITNIIDDAEQRMYRDLDLLSTRVRVTGPLVANNRNFSIPTSSSGDVTVIEQMNVITPAGQTNPDLGTRVPMVPVSKEYLDAIWPSASPAGVPTLFAPISQQNWIVGQWPDAAYTIEVVCTVRPQSLSAVNQQTFLSVYLPDLFLSVGLSIGAGYLKDYGAATDDPQSGMSWEKKYTTQLKSATSEEARKKFQAQGWGSLSTGPEATPPRT